MRTIVKGAEPASLTAHRHTEHCDYDNYPDKAALRQALATEQHGICCYCMGRIHNGPTTMKIEHWQSRTNYPAEELTYRNLLGACRGGEGMPPHLQHCDTRKGDRELLWNPADLDHHVETRIYYELDGSIRSSEPDFDFQLTDVLNLNHPQIENNRKGVLNGLLQWWTTDKPVPKPRIEREIATRTTGDGEFTPYCHVAVWWLQQKHARMA